MIRIMVVDDEELSRMNIRLLITRNFKDVKVIAEADNGEDAIRYYEKYRPDGVIMDIRMKEMNGLETSRQILNDYPDAKIIICSAYDNFSLVSQALEIGIKGYMLKPIRKEDLVEKVTKIFKVSASPVEMLLGQQIVTMLINNEIKPDSIFSDQIARLYGDVSNGLLCVSRFKEEDIRNIFKEYAKVMKKCSIRTGYAFSGIIENQAITFFSPAPSSIPDFENKVHENLHEAFPDMDYLLESAPVAFTTGAKTFKGLNEILDNPLPVLPHLPNNNLWLNRVVALIQDESLKNISLESIANELTITPQYLSANFREQSGMNFKEYIMLRRMQYARKLIAIEDLSNTDLAERCGYNDCFYFMKIFKKTFGESPKAYRQSHQK